jgi:hypothetical protein
MSVPGVAWSPLPSPNLRLLSLGAGVQSSTLLLMALAGEIPGGDLDGAIFADTGWEPASVYRNLEWLERQVAGRIPIHRVSHGNIRDDVLASVDGPSARNPPFWVRGNDDRAAPLRRKCTSAYKIEVIDRKVRELLGIPKGHHVKDQVVEKWVGISSDEIVRIKPSGRPWMANRYPLVEAGISRADCLRWMADRGYPEPPKSACIGCPYRSDASWREMRDRRPEEFADAVAFESGIMSGVNGTGKPGIFLHRSLLPLDQVEFKPAPKYPLFGDFAGECDGMCGL